MTQMSPLFRLPLTPHPNSDPSPLTAVSGEDLARDTGRKLANFAQGGGEERARVVKLFNIFLNYLPKDGTVMLMQVITNLADDESLQQLHDHLIDGILKPRMLERTLRAPRSYSCFD